MSEKSAWTGASPHIDKSDLLCKTGCGYYGNPAWNGHCSKCYKELVGKKQRKPVFDPTKIKNKVSLSVSDVSELQSKATSLMSRKFDNIDAKFDKRTKAVKSIFKKSPSLKLSQDHGKMSHFNEESQLLREELEEHIKSSLSSDAQSNINKHIRNFEEKIQKLTLNHSVDDLSEQFQDFYNILKDMTFGAILNEELNQDQINKIVLLSERYITTRYYRILSSIVNPFSEEKDLAIQKRIRSLTWVSCSHLECNIDESNDENKNILDEIIADLLEVDSKWIPSEKLALLVCASHLILNLLNKSSGGSPASADDFLPALIYCIIRANPPLLHSNICYITSFAQQSSLQSGEAGYFFTNLCCAVSFIEKLTAESLGLTDEEFDHYMSGDALSPNALDGTYFCDAILMLKQSLGSLEEYENCLSKVLSSYDEITIELDECKDDINTRLDFLKETFPLIVKSKHTNIDEPDPDQELLPPPLEPQSMMPLESFENKDSAKSLELGDSFLSDDLLTSASVNSDLGDKGSVDADARPWDPFSSILNSSNSQSFYEHLGSDEKSLTASFSLVDSHSTSSMLQPPYTGFTIQGGRIPNIPCDTGVNHSIYSNPHSLSPLLDDYRDSLPPPLSPTVANPVNHSHGSKEHDT